MILQLNLDIHDELIIDNFAGGGGAALVEATGALDKVSATRNIGSAHIVAREALARCKEALK